MSLPLILLGGGGHAKVLINTLLLLNRQILGYCDLQANGEPVLGVKRMGSEEMILRFAHEEVLLVNGVGSPFRSNVYERFVEKGYLFEKVIHPSAVLATDVRLADGVQVMAGAVVQPGVSIGLNTIINTAASVDHDCILGNHVHIAPGAILCGQVRIGDGAQINAGATVIQGKSVGAGSIVGAGAVVLEDIPPNVTALGMPARVTKRGVTKIGEDSRS